MKRNLFMIFCRDFKCQIYAFWGKILPLNAGWGTVRLFQRLWGSETQKDLGNQTKKLLKMLKFLLEKKKRKKYIKKSWGGRWKGFQLRLHLPGLFYHRLNKYSCSQHRSHQYSRMCQALCGQSTMGWLTRPIKRIVPVQ